MIRVAVAGACGKMGLEAVKAVHKEDNLALVGAVDIINVGEDIGYIAGIGPIGVNITDNLEKTLTGAKVDVLVDFTNPESVFRNAKISLQNKVYPVIGTTGLLPEEIDELNKIALDNNISALIAPNFAIGAILMMKFAREAAKYLPNVEIIELHHDKKLDAPSGTAIKTAELIREVRSFIHQGHPDEQEKIPCSRGGNFDGLRIHSVRLPGMVAHQEVIFGGLGQILTIRHDSLNRESFMPGVVLAINKIMNHKGVVYGLENLLNE